MPLQAGDRVGQYEIIKNLQSGGLATIYIARRLGTQGFTEHVALKVLRSELVDSEWRRETFLERARMALRVRHPNVVRVEEVTQDHGTYFVAAEYVHGVSLARFLESLGGRSQRLTPDMAVWIASQVAAGLHALHEAKDEAGRKLGLVHGDVRLRNVLLSSTGQTKVIDFAVARARGALDEDASRRTSRFVAPEQEAGEPFDRRADAFSLVAMLWEMLTMRRISRKVVLEDPVSASPSKHNPAITPRLDALVLRALSRDPAARPASLHALRMDLLETVPRAHTIDPSDVANLLAVTAGPELERSRLSMPPSVAVRIASMPPAAPIDSVPSSRTPLRSFTEVFEEGERTFLDRESEAQQPQQQAVPVAPPAPRTPAPVASATPVAPALAAKPKKEEEEKAPIVAEAAEAREEDREVGDDGSSADQVVSTAAPAPRAPMRAPRGIAVAVLLALLLVGIAIAMRFRSEIADPGEPVAKPSAKPLASPAPTTAARSATTKSTGEPAPIAALRTGASASASKPPVPSAPASAPASAAAASASASASASAIPAPAAPSASRPPVPIVHEDF